MEDGRRPILQEREDVGLEEQHEFCVVIESAGAQERFYLPVTLSRQLVDAVTHEKFGIEFDS